MNSGSPILLSAVAFSISVGINGVKYHIHKYIPCPIMDKYLSLIWTFNLTKLIRRITFSAIGFIHLQYFRLFYSWMSPNISSDINPDSKVPGPNMGPAWDLSAPDGPHVGPMNIAFRAVSAIKYAQRFAFVLSIFMVYTPIYYRVASVVWGKRCNRIIVPASAKQYLKLKSFPCARPVKIAPVFEKAVSTRSASSVKKSGDYGIWHYKVLENNR